ncbi:DUF3977 family protein [Paenibacillus methanolicus]|uniref:Uncharacterized protein DUF3977 n=1 Tax=Paenibacillus methanolicus TaxID=582686 RepID=A0A5S5C5T6_9BACL|nr:DUF3977 family protein [Paenibacillus methanolicus]TYP74539.1 uncharacterized protein DUF3977 [Paenibacillus methanolicus]
MKYIEAGIGNTWIVRTETELEDGAEIEQKGVIMPIIYHSAYARIWIGKTVFIADTKEGFKKTRKSRRAFKCVVGIASYRSEAERERRD